MSRAPLVGDREFRNQVVRIADLTVNIALLEGYQFSNCRIIGPAVLGLLDGVTITNCGWDAPGIDAVFWEVPPERGPVVGAVGVANCTFSNCSFTLIGVAGPPELRAVLERAFNSH